ncbi:MAG: DegT/DnrJ/EryC1/StrS family aminotransferase [Chloroflexi bacterium]|nr:DegT/DnrJ/EryC1/StrS family aminotransferase [Chloroflexota bacterium]
MKIPILRLPYTEEDIDFIKEGIAETLRSGFITMGRKVVELERAFASFIAVKHAIAVNSGTSALEIVLRAMGVEGASVVVPTVTFMATATAVVHAGGRVIFADVMRENLSLDPDDLRRKLRKDTSGVIIVHIGGIISPLFHEIKAFCDERDLFLLEDAAHAHGAAIDGVKAGALGIAGAFSFYPTKVLTTAEGGMITTNDDAVARMADTLRDHGKADHRFNLHTEFGYNWRFSEIHAVLGLQQMRKADSYIKERQRIARAYDRKLAGTKRITLVEIPGNVECPYYKYIVYLDENIDRDALKRRMLDEYGVNLTGEVYAEPLHIQPVFKSYPGTMLNGEKDNFPGAGYVCQRQICLPVYPGLSEGEIDYVVDSLKRCLR